MSESARQEETERQLGGDRADRSHPRLAQGNRMAAVRHRRPSPGARGDISPTPAARNAAISAALKPASRSTASECWPACARVGPCTRLGVRSKRGRHRLAHAVAGDKSLACQCMRVLRGPVSADGAGRRRCPSTAHHCPQRARQDQLAQRSQGPVHASGTLAGSMSTLQQFGKNAARSTDVDMRPSGCIHGVPRRGAARGYARRAAGAVPPASWPWIPAISALTPSTIAASITRSRPGACVQQGGSTPSARNIEPPPKSPTRFSGATGGPSAGPMASSAPVSAM